MILYFSGTGNSRYVARTLAAIFSEECHPIEPSMRGGSLQLPATDRHLIWVFPVYSWGIPPYVRSVMRSIDISTAVHPVPMHAVITCGDDCGRADRMWRRDARSRGWITGAVCTIQMPNNYVAMKGFDVDSPALAAEKLAAAPDTLGQIAASIKSGGSDMPVRLKFSGVKSHIVYPWFVRFAISPKPFHSNEGCISCSLCARSCPMQNITMRIGRPQWGSQCALCLRCYHICPRHAVAYGKATDGKGQSIVEKL